MGIARTEQPSSGCRGMMRTASTGGQEAVVAAVAATKICSGPTTARSSHGATLSVVKDTGLRRSYNGTRTLYVDHDGRACVRTPAKGADDEQTVRDHKGPADRSRLAPPRLRRRAVRAIL